MPNVGSAMPVTGVEKDYTLRGIHGYDAAKRLSRRRRGENRFNPDLRIDFRHTCGFYAADV